VAVGVFSAGTDQQEIDSYQPSLPLGYVGIEEFPIPGQAEVDWSRVLEVTRRALPSAQVVPIQTPDEATFVPTLAGFRSAGPWVWSIVDDGTALPALTGADPADIEAARRVLAAGGVVVTGTRTVVDGEVTLVIDDTKWVSVPAYALTTGTPGVAIAISPAALTHLGLTAHTHAVVVQTSSPPTVDDVEGLRLALADVSPSIQVRVESEPSRSSNPIQLVLALVAAAIALGAAGIATGLAAADSQPDLATLAAVGANPALRRKLSLSQAGLIAGLGAVLGTITGLGTAAALVVASNQLSPSFDAPVPFVIPWTSIAIVIAAPLLAMAGAGLLTRSGLPIERRF